MTLSELRTRCLERLDEVEGGLRWSSDEIDGYLNLANQTLSVRAGVNVATSTIQAAAGEMYYNLPTDCVTPIRLYRNDPLEKVWPSHPRKLDAQQRNWQSVTGTRWEWYFLFGLNQIAAGPIFTTTGESYTLTYLRDPSLVALVADSDEPDFPKRYHQALVDYAIARALMPDADEERLRTVAASMVEFATTVKRVRREAQRAWGRTRTMRPEDSDANDWGAIA